LAVSPPEADRVPTLRSGRKSTLDVSSNAISNIEAKENVDGIGADHQRYYRKLQNR
jgi:hypothetical protein